MSCHDYNFKKIMGITLAVHTIHFYNRKAVKLNIYIHNVDECFLVSLCSVCSIFPVANRHNVIGIIITLSPLVSQTFRSKENTELCNHDYTGGDSNDI